MPKPRTLARSGGRAALGWIGVFLGSALAVAADGPPPEQVEFFEAKVRPVLAESCGKCHGPSKQASGLRLDTREAVLEGGLNGPSVVPGDPDTSLLVQAVRQTHEDIKMPPKGKLSDDAVEAIASWVKMGAPWPSTAPKTAAGAGDAAATHWAFQPLKPVPPPVVKDVERVRTPVDAFVLDRLEKAGIAPSPEAGPRTLIRRLTFDLTGLPPTPEEVDAFLADASGEAYERLVDRLLASPRYGERWGRHWLDVARYADTKGYVFTQERRYPYSYTYRDYVVQALNDDKPFDAFVVDQVAADRLGPGNDPRSLAALGFLTVGRRFLNNQDDIIDDRIDVVTRGFLGLTVACARCHDHKFDPIPTDDYYSLYGVFNSSTEPAELPEIPGAVAEPLANDFRAKLAEKQKVIDDYRAGRVKAVQDDFRARTADYLRAALELKFEGRGGRLDEVARAAKLPPARLRAFATRWKARLDATREAFDPVLAPWHDFAAIPEGEFSRKAPTAAKSIPETVNPVVAAAFRDDPPSTMAEVAARYGAVLAKSVAEPGDGPGRQELKAWVEADKSPLRVAPDTIDRAIDRAERDKLTRLKAEADKVAATHPGAPPRAMVLNDLPKPVEPHVFLRGNSGRPGKQVPRQFLKLIAGPDRKPFADGSGRLELARAIASKDNPLTPRVIVNRLWFQHFGAGLVATPSDFGVRSDPPTHPELLDWLAADFTAHGWSLKHLHRRIVLSSTYRQASDDRPEAKAKDPENRLVWKFNRRRLEFEALRDALLATSGALDPAVGGRPVVINEPPFPPRRTIYGFIDRQNLDGVYRTFDFASPDASSPRRYATTVPQQALFLMNSPFVIEQARRLAARPELSNGPAGSRVDAAYARVFGREPTEGERAVGVAFVQGRERSGPSLPTPVWGYGVGRVDASSGKTAGFRAFPHWTGTAWQFGPTLPHPEGGYLHWQARGGHVGADLDHAAVLRWTAPEDASVNVAATLGHEGAPGDGVRGRVVSSRSGVLGEWVAHNAKVPTPLSRVEVKRGDTIDFVVDCRGDSGYDTFTWSPVVREADRPTLSWDAKADFQGRPAPGLAPWEQYAQVLLLTNEFLFVD